MCRPGWAVNGNAAAGTSVAVSIFKVSCSVAIWLSDQFLLSLHLLPCLLPCDLHFPYFLPPCYPNKTGQGLFSPGLRSGMDDATASQPSYVSAATAQLHYEGPPEREVHQGDMPQHLYGGLKYGVHQLLHVVC